ncbi:unnamed protein product, partial [Ixodes pacificus]
MLCPRYNKMRERSASFRTSATGKAGNEDSILTDRVDCVSFASLSVYKKNCEASVLRYLLYGTVLNKTQRERKKTFQDTVYPTLILVVELRRMRPKVDEQARRPKLEETRRHQSGARKQRKATKK